MKFKLEEIFSNYNGILKNGLPSSYGKFVVDSRHVKPSDIFIALKGSRVDGHDFIKDALSNGAVGVVVEKECVPCEKGFVYRVNSTLDFIKYLGNLARDKVNGAIIGITGSAGKTTTKEGLYLALSKKFNTTKTEGNLNTEVSLPLFFVNDVSGMEDFVVVEMGIQKPNDMDILLDIVKPHYAIITNIGESHLEYLGSKEGVLKEKFKLVDYVVNHGGVSFVNGDDPLLKDKAKPYKGIFRVGFNEDNDFRISVLEEGFNYSKLRLSVLDRVFEFSLPYANFYHNVAIIFAVAFYLGVDPDYIISSLKEFRPYAGRGNVLDLGEVVLIDDTYNSNPVSLRLALERISKIDAPKVLILGDMLELGKESDNIHREFGKIVSNIKPYLLITYGTLSKAIYEEADVPLKYHFDNEKSLEEFLNSFNFWKHCYILIKGSRGMKMETFVNVLKGRFQDGEK